MEERTIEIPENTSVEVENGAVTVKGKLGTVSREFSHPQVGIELQEGGIRVFQKVDKKAVLALTGTYASHIKNMIHGVNEGFEYRLRLVYAHFPVKLEVRDGKVAISNFLGERAGRFADILEQVEVKISKDELVVKGSDIERVGQTCANIEKATKIKNKDRRVFQDGAYLYRRIRT